MLLGHDTKIMTAFTLLQMREVVLKKHILDKLKKNVSNRLSFHIQCIKNYSRHIGLFYPHAYVV